MKENNGMANVVQGSTILFDTLAYARQLKKAGVDDKVAQAHAEALTDALRGSIVTKGVLRVEIQDLNAELTAKIQELRTELKAEIQNLRVEFKTEIQNLRVEFKADIHALSDKLMIRGIFALMASTTLTISILAYILK